MNITEGKKIYFYLLIIFFAIFVGSGLFLALANKDGTGNQQAVATSTAGSGQQDIILATPAPKQGLFSILPSSNTTSVGDQVTFNIKADSNNKNIVGYDLLVFYDPLSFNFINATSDLPNFKIYNYAKANYISLTAIKNPQDKTASTFFNTDVLNLTFKAVKVGQSTFSLKSKAGSETTDMTTDKSEVLNPALNNVTISVK